MIDGKNVSNEPVNSKYSLRTYDNIQKIATGQGDDFRTGCLLDYNYFNIYYKRMVIDLIKQQALDSNPKTIQQIRFTRNLARERNLNTSMFSIFAEAKETI